MPPPHPPPLPSVVLLFPLEKVVARLDMRRGGVLLELEKNDMHKDDAAEIVETLTGMAESYGYSEEEGEEDREG